MATTGVRTGLIKPDPSEDVDISIINANMDRIDASLGCVYCTSTTRPSAGAVFDGLLIKERDTGLKYIWNSQSSAWDVF